MSGAGFAFRTRGNSGVCRLYEAIPADGSWIGQAEAFAAASVSQQQGIEHARRLAGFAMIERTGNGNAARHDSGLATRYRRIVAK